MFGHPSPSAALADRVALLERQVDELREAQSAQAQERALEERVNSSLREHTVRRRRRVRDVVAVAGALGGLAALGDLIVRLVS